MIGRLIRHANQHSVGYVALVFSLLAMAGASYAAFIPDHSIGTKQLKNGAVGEKQLKNTSIDPVKWDPTYVTAFVRRYVQVAASGHVITGSPNSQAAADPANPGTFDVTWGDSWNATCIAQATVNPAPSSTTTSTTTTTPTSTTTTTPSTTSTTTTTTTPSTTTTTPTTTTPNGGFADTSPSFANGGATVVKVTTFNAAGQAAPEPFSLAIICPRGAGGGTTYPVTLP